MYPVQLPELYCFGKSQNSGLPARYIKENNKAIISGMKNRQHSIQGVTYHLQSRFTQKNCLILIHQGRDSQTGSNSTGLQAEIIHITVGLFFLNGAA